MGGGGQGGLGGATGTGGANRRRRGPGGGRGGVLAGGGGEKGGGKGAQFFKSRGMHSGNYFRGWIRDLLAAKGKTRFGDLRNADDPGDPKRAYKLQVIASDLSARSMLVLPQDAEQLGTHPDDLEIAEAIRMSMSIPVFFQPVSMNKHEIVDGGLLSNFPVWLFDTAPGAAPRFPTFGLLLVAPGQTAPLMPTPPGAR